MIEKHVPILGFCAWSGTGKTTLLRQLLPLLVARGMRVAVVKHAHHKFDIDHPGKDSYELRKAGACQMLISSRRRMALMTEFEAGRDEPTLSELLDRLELQHTDLVLVEGFKHERYPKIELHRPSLNKPLLFPDDPNVIAFASDVQIPEAGRHLPALDLNDPGQIADFIIGKVIGKADTSGGGPD